MFFRVNIPSYVASDRDEEVNNLEACRVELYFHFFWRCVVIFMKLPYFDWWCNFLGFDTLRCGHIIVLAPKNEVTVHVRLHITVTTCVI